MIENFIQALGSPSELVLCSTYHRRDTSKLLLHVYRSLKPVDRFMVHILVVANIQLGKRPLNPYTMLSLLQLRSLNLGITYAAVVEIRNAYYPVKESVNVRSINRFVIYRLEVQSCLLCVYCVEECIFLNVLSRKKLSNVNAG